MPKCTDSLWRIVLCLTILLPLLASAEEPALPLVTLCDLANDPMKYAGKTIRLQGEIAFGRHGWALFDHNCPSVLLGGGKWSNSVSIGRVSPEAEMRLMTFAVLYEDWRNVGMRSKFEAILLGQLEVVQNMQFPLKRDGTGRGSGFGSSGHAPFRLGVLRVEYLNVSIREIPLANEAEARK
jgi:hypothetical protein